MQADQFHNTDMKKPLQETFGRPNDMIPASRCFYKSNIGQNSPHKEWKDPKSTLGDSNILGLHSQSKDTPGSSQPASNVRPLPSVPQILY